MASAAVSVSAVAYTRGEHGTELLLESRGGILHTHLFASASAEEQHAVSARQLSAATGGLFASPAESDAEAHLLGKLRAGKGVIELSATGRRLYLVPTRRAEPAVPPPDEYAPASRLEWCGLV